MYRVLFDVTAKGLAILQKCFRLPKLELAEASSNGTAENPHVGSIMLAPPMLQPIGIFAPLARGGSSLAPEQLPQPKSEKSPTVRQQAHQLLEDSSELADEADQLLSAAKDDPAKTRATTNPATSGGA